MLTRSLFRMADDLLSLAYPNLCLVCDRNLPAVESLICPTCLHALPKTDYHLLPENGFTDRLLGRVYLEFGAAAYYFSTGGHVQRLLHHFKYYNRPEIGLKIGRIYGEALLQSPHFHRPDAIVPVPLHPKKLHKRGYNQSAWLARGLAEQLQAPVFERGLERVVHSTSQTRKNRSERSEVVDHTFRIGKLPDLSGRRLLLVDDLLTTGATLEACAAALQPIDNLRLSMVTLAIAEQ